MEMPMIDNENSADNAINANNVSALHGASIVGIVDTVGIVGVYGVRWKCQESRRKIAVFWIGPVNIQLADPDNPPGGRSRPKKVPGFGLRVPGFGLRVSRQKLSSLQGYSGTRNQEPETSISPVPGRSPVD